MGFLFGDSMQQAEQGLSANSGFNPTHIQGSGSGHYVAPVQDYANSTEQTARQEKKDSVDLAASVGVGVGGDGSGGAVDKYTGGETDNGSYGKTSTPISTNYTPLYIVGAALLGVGALFLFRRKRKQK